MESSSCAVLNVDIENKEKDNDHSTLSNTFNTSLVQSPSLESFSTIEDVEVLSELQVDDNSDLSVRVDNPQKHLDTLETYITFRITTRVARIEFAENEYVVRRRYNEFMWLRQRLTDSHPFCIISPLPGKHTLIGQLDRYSKEFILHRMKLLNTFMMRIADHPILSCNEHFKVFLTANQFEFASYRRQKFPTNKLPLGHYPLVARKQYHEFEKTKDYLSQLAAKLGAIDKVAYRINKERNDFIADLQQYHPTFNAWANSEPQLALILQTIANAFEKSTFARSALASIYYKLFDDPIKEFMSYIEAVEEVLHKRDLYQRNYEGAADELSKKRTEKDQLLALQNAPQSSGFSLWKQPSCDEKLEKLGTTIPQLMKKVETNQDYLECANESLRSDLIRWHQEKQKTLKKVLSDFVNKQIEYYEKSVSAWEHAISELSPQTTVTNNTKK